MAGISQEQVVRITEGMAAFAEAIRQAYRKMAASTLGEADLEFMCRAHDQEEAAQKGEPSPWDILTEVGTYEGDLAAAGEFEQFRKDRIATMRAALKAVGLA